MLLIFWVLMNFINRLVILEKLATDFGCCITSIVEFEYMKRWNRTLQKKSWWLSSLKGLGIWCCCSNNISSTSPCSPPPCSLWPTNHILDFWYVVVVLRRVFLKSLPWRQRSIACWWKSITCPKGWKKNHYLWHWQFSFVTICHWLHGLGRCPHLQSASKIYANFFIHYISDFYHALVFKDVHSTFHATYSEAIHLRIAREPSSFLRV